MRVPLRKDVHVIDYQAIGTEIGQLVNAKQEAYGDSFGRSGAVMRLLYPEGIPPEKLDDALAIVRVLDKLFRIATDRDAFGESPWRDIAGYGLLGAALRQRVVADREGLQDALSRAEELLAVANQERHELRLQLEAGTTARG